MFVRQKIRSVAILKCLGATTGQVLATYVLQVVLLGADRQPARRRARRRGAGGDSGVADRGDRRHLVRADAVGGAAGPGRRPAGVAAVRAGAAARHPPGEAAAAHSRPRRAARRGWPRQRAARRSVAAWWRAIDWTQVGRDARGQRGAGRAWRRGRRRRCGSGAIVSIGFAARRAGAASGRRWPWCAPSRPLALARWFPLRHAVIGLRRPGNQTRVILLAVGLGSFFVLGVRALQSNLVANFSLEAQRGRRRTCS